MARQIFKVSDTFSIKTVVLHITLDITKGLELRGPGDVGGAPSTAMLIPIVTGASSIGTLALIMAFLGHLEFRSGVSDIGLVKQGLTNFIKLPQLTTGEQGMVGIGCHMYLPQPIGQLGHTIRPREGH